MTQMGYQKWKKNWQKYLVLQILLPKSVEGKYSMAKNVAADVNDLST